MKTIHVGNYLKERFSTKATLFWTAHFKKIWLNRWLASLYLPGICRLKPMHKKAEELVSYPWKNSPYELYNKLRNAQRCF